MVPCGAGRPLDQGGKPGTVADTGEAVSAASTTRSGVAPIVASTQCDFAAMQL